MGLVSLLEAPVRWDHPDRGAVSPAELESDRPNESIDSLRGLCGPTLVTES